ncbi:hypothetical protein BAU07_10545 [Bordetella flabilis]|uniref:Peptidase M10 metallopeptidase domain-containing protein n=2 Tax=Bordetella flabilis TaxID=463014 RepID=A0A193GBU3_9BORD|nr:hypothetical protein BAU07_10545 [Bordetella flabilis]
MLLLLFTVAAAVADTVPPRYRNVRLFMDPDGPGGQLSSRMPYDPCARYNKALRYTVSGEIVVQFGASRFSFALRDLVAQAAQTWNAKLQPNGCSFSIGWAGLSTPNFVIDDSQSNSAFDAVARAIPRGYEAITHMQAGLYVNAGTPITLSANAAGKVKAMFSGAMSDEDVAQAVALVTLLHEFGHALGLAHPIEEPGNRKDAMGAEYSPYSMEWIPRATFDRGPIMIGATDRMLDVMWKTLGKRPLTLADMQPSDVEAGTVRQMLSCSAIQLLRDAQRDASCPSFLAGGRRVLQYPDLLRPAIGLFND